MAAEKPLNLEEKLVSRGLSKPKAEKLVQYFLTLERWTKRIDLVAPAPTEVLFKRHIEDCLLAGLELERHGLLGSEGKTPEGKGLAHKGLDVGSGAGLPGVVWHVVSGSPFILLEPRQKRCQFLRQITRDLSLEGIDVVNNRLESFSAENLTLITSRAVGMSKEILHFGLTNLKSGGCFVEMGGGEARHVEAPPQYVSRETLSYVLADDRTGRRLLSYRLE